MPQYCHDETNWTGDLDDSEIDENPYLQDVRMRPAEVLIITCLLVLILLSVIGLVL